MICGQMAKLRIIYIQKHLLKYKNTQDCTNIIINMYTKHQNMHINKNIKILH